MVVEALQFYKKSAECSFCFSNIDGDHVNEIIKKLNPETTLFLWLFLKHLPQETLTNSETIKSGFIKGFGTKQEDIAKHFVAVSTNIQK
jgi:glucose-6-phosphate isomerase